MDLTESLDINSNKSARHPWELARLKVITKLLQNISNFKQQRAISVMDIGCGDAFFVNQLRLKWPKNQYYAVDSAFTTETIKTLQGLYGIDNPMYFNNLEGIKLDEPLNAILLMDVIEHIEDDHGFLKNLNSLSFTNKQTQVLITVPAFQSLFSAHDTFLKHYRRYNLKLLKETLQESGLIITESGYFFSTLIIPRLLSLLKEKLTGKNPEPKGIGDWHGNKLISYLLINALSCDYSINRMFHKLGVNLPGLSLYAICHPAV